LPFWGSTTPETFARVCQCDVDLESHPWSFISFSAKDLVRRLLNKVPYMRPTAEEVLMDPWILSFGFPKAIFSIPDPSATAASNYRNSPLPAYQTARGTSVSVMESARHVSSYTPSVYSPIALPLDCAKSNALGSVPTERLLPHNCDEGNRPIISPPCLPPLLIPRQRFWNCSDSPVHSPPSESGDPYSPMSAVTSANPLSPVPAVPLYSYEFNNQIQNHDRVLQLQQQQQQQNQQNQNQHIKQSDRLIKPLFLSKESCRLARQRVLSRRRAAKELATSAVATVTATTIPPFSATCTSASSCLPQAPVSASVASIYTSPAAVPPLKRRVSSNKRKLTDILEKCPVLAANSNLDQNHAIQSNHTIFVVLH
jgi:serine/threonine protein kinase